MSEVWRAIWWVLLYSHEIIAYLRLCSGFDYAFLHERIGGLGRLFSASAVSGKVQS